MADRDSMQAKAVVFESFGGPEVLEVRDVEVPPPGPGEIRVRTRAFGLNRSEGYYRAGLYAADIAFPARIGYEGAGVVESVGPGVTGFAVGDRVGSLPGIQVNACGCHGEAFTVPENFATHTPPELTDVEGAALWSSYLTTYGMAVDLVDIRPGDWVVATAASSSIGSPLMQMVAIQGGRVIATTRTAAKAQAVRDMGAEHVIVTDDEDLVERIKEITDGKGARFVFDPIGGLILDKLIDAMAPRGTLVLYSIMDFAPVEFPVRKVVANNLKVLGFALMIAEDQEQNRRAITFIREGVRQGKLRPLVGKTFALDDIREAVGYFESLQHVGKVVVVPDQP